MGVMRRAYPACFAAAFALTFLLQMLGGAYTADFAGNPDEPAHYVTGVMVRDYCNWSRSNRGERRGIRTAVTRCS
jgi:hypothetical protein